jgi:hypothetical protein
VHELPKARYFSTYNPPKRPKKHEFNSLKHTAFFYAWNTRENGTSLRAICRQSEINFPHQTASYWLRQREIQDSPALRRTRKQSTRLGRPYQLVIEKLKSLLDPSHL